MIPDTGRLVVGLPASSPPIAQRLGRLQWFESPRWIRRDTIARFDGTHTGLWLCRDTHAPACAVVAQVVDIDGACAWRVRTGRMWGARWSSWTTARNVEEAKACAWWACIARVW